jgi:lactonase
MRKLYMGSLKNKTLAPALLTSTIMVCGITFAEDNGGLSYSGEKDALMNVPIPPSEQNLQTVTAEPWYKVSEEGIQLEGPAFDEEGNLFFVEVFDGRVFKLSPDMVLTTILEKNDYSAAGLAIHNNGKLFIAGLGDFETGGTVFSISPDGTDREVIIEESHAYLPDDLVFDQHGGFYFTDFRGNSSEPDGGMLYVRPDFSEVTPVLANLSIGNGVALNAEENVVWVSELSAGRLHRVSLASPGEIAPFGTAVTYHFTGTPDSMRTDVDGNVYVAMYGQARVMVFNRNGLPIGQILLPKRDEGHNLRSTSMAFKPGTDELYIFTNDWDGGEGSQIFKTNGFANGTALYSHQ